MLERLNIPSLFTKAIPDKGTETSMLYMILPWGISFTKATPVQGTETLQQSSVLGLCKPLTSLQKLSPIRGRNHVYSYAIRFHNPGLQKLSPFRVRKLHCSLSRHIFTACLQKITPLRGRKREPTSEISARSTSLQKITPFRGRKQLRDFVYKRHYRTVYKKPHPRLGYIPFPTLKIRY